MSADDELQRARARRRLYELLDELEIIGSVRDAMIAEPERAVSVLEYARAGRGVRNPAALAIAKWRQGAPSTPPPAPAELERVPPDLDALEYVWSRPATVTGELILRLMATAIARHGGYAALRQSFARHRS